MRRGPAKRVRRLLWGVGIGLVLLLVAFEVYGASGGEGLRFVGAGGQCHGKLVVVVHGWLEKGQDRWGQYCAEAIAERADANEWSCAYYEWSKGAITLNPRDAAVYARDKGGANLAAAILETGVEYQHIHLVGHSSAAWLVSEAAKILARESKADIHLTFLDAYVPLGWDEKSLGDIETTGRKCFVEQYFTRDMTGPVTERKLTWACNIDITSLDGLVRDHNFPRYWYYATVAGRYPQSHPLLAKRKVITQIDGVEWGFCMARESTVVEGSPE